MYSLTWIDSDRKLRVITNPDSRTICAIYDMMCILGVVVRMWDKEKKLMG